MSTATSTRETTATKPRRLYEVLKYPDPVLFRPADPITSFGPETAELADDMFASMYAAQGIGLAAPQIGISRQITTIDISFKERPDEKLVLINPEIIRREGELYEEEGCLSLPEIREKVRRAARVTVRAQDVHGDFFEVAGDDLLARAMQHEIDHLHGILFIQHLSRLKRDLLGRRIKKLIKNGEW